MMSAILLLQQAITNVRSPKMRILAPVDQFKYVRNAIPVRMVGVLS